MAAWQARIHASLSPLQGAVRFVRAKQSMLRHLAWRFANRNLKEGKWITVYAGHHLYVSLRDYRAYRIAALGGSQKEKVAFFERLCRCRPEIMLDIGANYGEFSVIPAALGIRCMLFEPNPLVARHLAQTMAGFPKTSIATSAVGSIEGLAQFFYCPTASGSGSFAQAVPTFEAGLRGGQVERIDVPVVTVDHFLASRLRTPPRSLLMKIDVEGFEREVLLGAENTLAGLAWWRALIEFSPEALRQARKSVAAEWEFFKSFRGFVLEGDAQQQPLERLRDLPRLSGELPARDCDVLIGAGRIGDEP